MLMTTLPFTHFYTEHHVTKAKFLLSNFIHMQLWPKQMREGGGGGHIGIKTLNTSFSEKNTNVDSSLFNL